MKKLEKSLILSLTKDDIYWKRFIDLKNAVESFIIAEATGSSYDKAEAYKYMLTIAGLQGYLR